MSTPAGWYDDPNQPGMQQYWDGNAWTGQMQPAPGAAATAPPPAPDPYGAPPANPYAQPANPYGGPPPVGGYPVAYGAVPGLPPAVAGRQVASWGIRVGAALIDGLINWTIIGWFVNVFLQGRDGPNNGQTLGKQVCNIRVIKDDGSNFSVGDSFMRELVLKGLLFGFLALFLLYIPLLLDVLWPLWDQPGKQTLHDKMQKTHVVVG